MLLPFLPTTADRRAHLYSSAQVMPDNGRLSSKNARAGTDQKLPGRTVERGVPTTKDGREHAGSLACSLG
jgi:hypothetical protein